MVEKVIPEMMLYEHIRNKLDNDGILRDVARDSDIIWQQMPLAYFNSLIKSKSLFTKPHSDFRDYDEKKLVQYMDTCYYLEKSNSKYSDLKDILNKIDNNTYISCWYNSKDLSDIAFKQYTGSDTGVAIGTTVEALTTCLNTVLKNDKCHVGNIQYIYHNEFEKEKIFENTQIICPFFLKGMQFCADNEFRVCIETDNTQFTGSLKVCLKNLIKQIAIRNDGIYKDMRDCEIVEIFNRKINRIGLSVGEIIRENGFIIMKMRKSGMKLLSGKYDSTKQRAVLLQGNRWLNYRRYTTTMRLEMLLTGGVLVTDAQFYDGLYFSWMARNNEIADFIKFANNTNLFKIMQRAKDMDEALTKMCCKEFLFSSIESKKLQTIVQEIGKDYQISDVTLKRNKEKTLDDYLNNMWCDINQIHGDIYKHEWDIFYDGIKKLYNAVQSYPAIITEWDLSSTNRFKYKDLLSQYIDGGKKYIDEMVDVINEYKKLLSKITYANKYFAVILCETEKEFPNRSAIEENFYKLQELVSHHLSADKIQEAENIKHKYNRLFNDRYNKALAIQHYAGFLDVCDYHKHIKNVVSTKNIDVNVVNISLETIKKLSSMKWAEFESVVLNKVILAKKKHLLDAYCDNTVSNDEFMCLLETYISEIEEEIGKISVKDQIMPQFLDYKNTTDYTMGSFFSENNEISFIGGGSFIEGEDADSICLFRDLGEKIIYCIKINESDVANLDTVIAPVRNIFNGC